MTATLTLKRLGIRRHADEDVFAAALGGDPVAFSEVYRRYRTRIHGYCLARLMDPEAAADAAQEVFVRLLKAPRDGIEHPRAWLFAVARNVTIDVLRQRSRSPLVTYGDGPPDPGGSKDALDEVLGREDAGNVFLALRQLRPRYRTALILRELHHESSADMADALGTSPGAVDTLVSRARDAFGRAYAGVTALPADCRTAVAAVYKRRGTGLDAAADARLEDHLSGCGRCAEVAARASRVDGLSALVPFLLPVRKVGLNLFERATLTLGRSPELAAQFGYTVPSAHTGPLVKVATGLLALTLVAAPIAARVATPQVRASSVAVAAVRAPARTNVASESGSRSHYASAAQQATAECLVYAAHHTASTTGVSGSTGSEACPPDASAGMSHDAPSTASGSAGHGRASSHVPANGPTSVAEAGHASGQSGASTVSDPPQSGHGDTGDTAGSTSHESGGAPSGEHH